jgi:hypothetical protein
MKRYYYEAVKILLKSQIKKGGGKQKKSDRVVGEFIENVAETY